jgi:hypothetical protein
MKMAPHSLYSPDLASSDYYLFRSVKDCLASLFFESTDGFPETVQGILEGIEKGRFQAIFLECKDRLRKCIASNGEYAD